jgi:hypothetical protein
MVKMNCVEFGSLKWKNKIVDGRGKTVQEFNKKLALFLKSEFFYFYFQNIAYCQLATSNSNSHPTKPSH